MKIIDPAETQPAAHIDDDAAKQGGTAAPDSAYGALLEGVHIAGYSFERACAKLEWLLEADRWRGVGGGFDDVNAFIASIRLDSFRPLAEQRKRIAQRIKQLQPKVSNRAIAKTLGVDESTVRADTTAGNPARTPKRLNNNSEAKAPAAGNPAPVLTGAAAAKIVVRRENIEERRDERLARIAEIAKGNTALCTSLRYPLLYADPPWRYENPAMGSEGRKVENHYPTMTLEEIIALPVAELATEQAILYLWSTAPKLVDAARVIAAWGFDYRTCGVWDKEVMGMGYHFRNQHELLLVAKRGDMPAPAMGAQPASVYRERRTEHSVKPNFYYEMIERAYPTLPKIELFARGSVRPGWAAWGNQIASEPATPAAADDGLAIPGFLRRAAP
jgi:N6-adenosine-specific RNA methylase IME4